jgi:hypothetical protein
MLFQVKKTAETKEKKEATAEARAAEDEARIYDSREYSPKSVTDSLARKHREV